MYVEKALPGKLKDSDLAVFEKKCETLSQICDTMDLVLKKNADTMTDMSGDVVLAGNDKQVKAV